MKTYIVLPGDCMASIAAAHGFANWRTVFDYPANASLRDKRGGPDLLHPGDEITIPDPKSKSVTSATDKVHRFVVKRPPRKRLRLTLLQGDGEPLQVGPFELRFGGQTITGQISSGGKLDVEIPVDLHEATLVLGERTRRILIGHLNPMKETPDGGISGAQARLSNLGYVPGAIDGVRGPRTQTALRRFQEASGLDVTGALDDDTVKALEDAHGC